MTMLANHMSPYVIVNSLSDISLVILPLFVTFSSNAEEGGHDSRVIIEKEQDEKLVDDNKNEREVNPLLSKSEASQNGQATNADDETEDLKTHADNDKWGRKEGNVVELNAKDDSYNNRKTIEPVPEETSSTSSSGDEGRET